MESCGRFNPKSPQVRSLVVLPYQESRNAVAKADAMELSSKAGRVEMEAKERRQRAFFDQMEANILKSMSEGVVPCLALLPIPQIDPSLPKMSKRKETKGSTSTSSSSSCTTVPVVSSLLSMRSWLARPQMVRTGRSVPWTRGWLCGVTNDTWSSEFRLIETCWARTRNKKGKGKERKGKERSQ